MLQSQVTFVFESWVSMTEVEETHRLAQIAAQSMHGEDRVRLETRSYVDRTARTCVIDATTEAGWTLATIFCGYVRCEFGADAFVVRMSRNSL